MQYLVPDTIEAVVDALVSASGSAAVFAGGTDLLVQLRTGRRRPDLIIDLKKIPQLRSISIDAQNVRIGAAVCGAELSERQDIIREWPGVVEAFELIGSTQIQGRATMGGNLCNASPAADSIPALIAAGAVCVIAGAEGQREIAVENVVAEPGKTSLKPDEILVEFRLPRRAEYGGDAYQRFIPRTEMDIAVVGVGVNLTLDQNGVCQAARVALGAVSPTPLLVDGASAALLNTSFDEQSLARAAAATSAACNPINDKRGTIEYRTQITAVIFKRTAAIALERARQTL